MKTKGKILTIGLVTGVMVLINSDMSVIASNNKDPKAAYEVIQTEVIEKSPTHQIEAAQIKAQHNEIEKAKESISKLNKLTKELKESDKLKVDVAKKEKELKKLAIGETATDINIIADHFVATESVKSELKAITKAQKEEEERVAKEKAEAERKAQEEAARKAASQSQSASSGSSSSGSSNSSTSSGSSSSGSSSSGSSSSGSSSSGSSSSGSFTYTDWMWQMINSYPEPARRGLRGATVVNSLGGYAGMTYPASMTIEVALGFRDYTFRATVAHEIGHIYHLRTGAEQTDEWYDIFYDEWAGQGYYGSNNVMEAFADTFKSMYEPGSYGARSLGSMPRSVNYIQNLINSGV